MCDILRTWDTPRRDPRAEKIGGGKLLRAQERETQQKERREDPNEWADLPNFSGAYLDEREGKQAQAQSGGDTECERGRHEGNKGGERLRKIVPVHFGERGTHESAHQNQRRSGCVGWNGGDERGAEYRHYKKSGNEDVAKSCSRARSNTGGALDVTRDRGRSGQRPRHRAEGVGQEGSARPREFSVAQKSALFANAHQRSHVVKKIHKEEDKDQIAEAEFKGRAKIKLQERASWM